MIRALTSYLESMATGYTVGRNLFAGTWPAQKADEAVLICKSVGAPTDPEIPNERVLHVQVRTRAKSNFAAEDACETFFLVLLARTSIGVEIQRSDQSWWVHGPSDALDPQYLGQDALGRFEYSARVTLKLRQLTEA